MGREVALDANSIKCQRLLCFYVENGESSSIIQSNVCESSIRSAVHLSFHQTADTLLPSHSTHIILFGHFGVTQPSLTQKGCKSSCIYIYMIFPLFLVVLRLCPLCSKPENTNHFQYPFISTNIMKIGHFAQFHLLGRLSKTYPGGFTVAYRSKTLTM